MLNMHLRLKLSIIGNGSYWFWWNCQTIPWFKGGGVTKQRHFHFADRIFFFLFPMSLRFWGCSHPALILPSTNIRKCDPTHFQVSKAWELAWYWIYDSSLLYSFILPSTNIRKCDPTHFQPLHYATPPAPRWCGTWWQRCAWKEKRATHHHAVLSPKFRTRRHRIQITPLRRCNSARATYQHMWTVFFRKIHRRLRKKNRLRN